MERLLRTYFWWKGGLGEMSRNLRGGKDGKGKGNKWKRGGGDEKGKGKEKEGSGAGSGSNGKGGHGAGGAGGPPSYKRRRIRGGSVAASVTSGRKEVDKETGEEEEVGAELEDEAESIADLYVDPVLSLFAAVCRSSVDS
jgi:DNA excision repair protein ERCC-4